MALSNDFYTDGFGVRLEGDNMSEQIEELLKEFGEESTPTRRVLERIPEQHLLWKPHPTSTPMGILAMHVATVPGQLANALQKDEIDSGAGEGFTQSPEAVPQILTAFDRSQDDFESWIRHVDDRTLKGVWRLCHGAKVLISRPRLEIIRRVVFNHRYHHRGQLTVYLRMLGVPVPAIYGPSGDENPFQ
jgi:uncharacterized damage-inducible protein DinB